MVAKIGTLVIDLRASTAKFSQDMGKVSRRVSRLGYKIASVGRNMTAGITAPLGLAGGAALKTSMQFSKSMSEIQGLVGASRQQVTAWKADILKLAPVAGKGPQELAQALFFVTSAGIKGADAMKVLRDAAQASAAGLGDTATVADAVTSAMNAYGKAAMSADKATGILTAAVREGKLAAADLAPALGKVLPVAQSLGVSYDQVAASVAAMSRSGLNASEATTALRGILKAILKPAAQASQTLKKYGLSVDGVRKSVRENGLLATLQNLKNTFGDNKEAMAKMFPDIEGLSGVMNLLGGNAEATRKIFANLASETGGSLKTAFAAASKEDQFKFDQQAAAMSAAFIKIGTALGPVVIPLMEKLTAIIVKLTNWFGSLTPATRKLGLTIAGVFAIGGPILLALGTFVKIFGGAFALAGPVIAPVLTAGKVLLGLVATSGPIGLFLAAAGLVFAAYENWDKIKKIAKAVYTAVKTWLVDKFSAVVDAIGQKIDAVTGFFRDMWDKVAGNSYVPDMVAVISDEFGSLGAKMVAPTRAATRDVSKLFAGMGREVEGSISQALGSIVRARLPGGIGGQLLGGLANFGIKAISKGLGGLFGFAHGGSFTVGGGGGVDSRLVAFRATPGENVTVTPPGARAAGGGGAAKIFNIDARGASLAAVQELRNMVFALDGSINERAISAVADDRARGGISAQPLGA